VAFVTLLDQTSLPGRSIACNGALGPAHATPPASPITPWPAGSASVCLPEEPGAGRRPTPRGHLRCVAQGAGCPRGVACAILCLAPRPAPGQAV